MLSSFAKFLNTHRRRAIATELIRAYRSVDVPLLERLQDMTPTQIIDVTEVSIGKLLTAWERGQGRAYIEERMKAWEADQLDSSHIKMTDVDMSDIILIGTAQRQVLTSFIDEYTTDQAERTALTQAIKDHFTFARQEGTEAFFRIRMRRK
jgi:hypothetical protein